MKKIIIFLVMMLFITMTSGCSQNNGTKEQINLPKIVVGCDNYSPFSYADADGNMTGIDVELAKEAFLRIGYNPEFVFINWEEKKDLLKEGKIDCIWSSFTMTGREKEYHWAGPYMYSHQVIAVNTESDIVSLDDLKDKVLAVQSTTKPEDIIRRHDGTLPPLRKIISVQKRDLIFILLSKGYVDALAAHDTSIDQFEEDTGLDFRVLEEPLESVELGVAFSLEDNRDIYLQLTKVLSQMRKDGTVKRIISKYLKNAEKYMED